MIRRQSCPICDKELPADAAANVDSYPFCTNRCRQVDLLRWSDGKYAIVENLDPAVAELYRELQNGEIDENSGQ